MVKQEKYLTPKVEEFILSASESVLNQISTQGFKEDEEFDPSGFVLG